MRAAAASCPLLPRRCSLAALACTSRFWRQAVQQPVVWAAAALLPLLLCTPTTTGACFGRLGRQPEPKARTYLATMPAHRPERAFQLSPTARLIIYQGDITSAAVDAIVNAANERMLGGGGVDGAIHRTAGPELLEACKKVPQVSSGVRCPTGEARITPGFRLKAKHVIHTVGPVYSGAKWSAPLLAGAYRSSLALANEHGLSSVAFPAISCGVYGYPYDEAAQVSLQTVKEAVGGVREVHFVLFMKELYDEYVATAEEAFPEAGAAPAAAADSATGGGPAAAAVMEEEAGPGEVAAEAGGSGSGAAPEAAGACAASASEGPEAAVATVPPPEGAAAAQGAGEKAGGGADAAAAAAAAAAVTEGNAQQAGGAGREDGAGGGGGGGSANVATPPPGAQEASGGAAGTVPAEAEAEAEAGGGPGPGEAAGGSEGAEGEGAAGTPSRKRQAGSL